MMKIYLIAIEFILSSESRWVSAGILQALLKLNVSASDCLLQVSFTCCIKVNRNQNDVEGTSVVSALQCSILVPFNFSAREKKTSQRTRTYMPFLQFLAPRYIHPFSQMNQYGNLRTLPSWENPEDSGLKKLCKLPVELACSSRKQNEQ